MPAAEPQISPADRVRRGREVYDQFVRPHLRPEDDGKFVAIDLQTGAYELDADEIPAVRRLRERLPDAAPLLLCVGHPGTYSI